MSLHLPGSHPLPSTQAWPESPHTFHVLRGDMFLQVLHTGALQKFLHFIPSPVVGIELLQGEVGRFGGLLGARHPYGSLWLETYKGASIHGHIEEDMGFGALLLLLRKLATQGAANSERNCGDGEGQLCGCLRRLQVLGDVHPGAKGMWEKEGMPEDTRGSGECSGWIVGAYVKRSHGENVGPWEIVGACVKRSHDETVGPWEKGAEKACEGQWWFPGPEMQEIGLLRGTGVVRELWMD